MDNFSTGFISNIKEFERFPNFELFEADILDVEACVKATKDIDYVSHQAALGSVPRSISDPETTNNVNCCGFLNMLTAAAKSHVIKGFVYASSSSVYGDSPILPKKENV
ncbi:NAD-dependent epimerase/dehydratase family protein, partial [Klebsiella pneumoniae]|uniref:NAD-dependent epimerase/dehydratase family protein n=1 Tax=Klebsiella pneumoniae TaxID=573 RepID=UPI003851D53E